MKAIYFVSTGAFAGKSLVALILGLRLRAEGRRVAYFKPVGTLPVEVDGGATDQDALFLAEQLEVPAPASALCPVLFTERLAEQALAGTLGPLQDQVKQAFARISADQDVVLVGGVGDLSRGALLGLPASVVAELLGAQVILVAKYVSDSSVEEILLVPRLLGRRLRGVIFNFVPAAEVSRVREKVAPYLASQGIPVLGVVPRDDLLSSVTVSELAEQLPAKVLCCENKLGELVAHFIIGAMDVASAVRYFRERQDKAVITGGDRPDIQLAALQTPTKALILTGNLHPSPVIIKRAQQVGVPILLVGKDTLSTVEHIERIVGRLRVREEAKVKRAKELLESSIDFAQLYQRLGLNL